MRRSGSQFLARANVDIWRIQAWARHSSAAILLYIEDAHLPSLETYNKPSSATGIGQCLAQIFPTKHTSFPTACCEPALVTSSRP